MSELSMRDPDAKPNSLIMLVNETEWIKISDDGFWVRGVKVEQGPTEARVVYEAFREFLMWNNLTRTY